MNRNMLVFTAVALVIVALATPFQFFGVPLAPVAALLVGAVAGWWLSQAEPGHEAAGGAKAGLIVGMGALLGSIIGLALLGLFVGNLPEVQQFVQASEPHPEARIPADWVAPLGALAGVVLGFLLGVFDLILSAVAGWAAGALHGHNQPMSA